MAGNGTIGLEVLEDLPDVDAVVIPYGGGGLTAGIASAVKALRPETKVFTVEPETGAPFAASFAAGSAAEGRVHAVVRRRRGRAARAPEDVGHRLASSSTARSSATLDETAAAVRLLAERVRVIAEGAGALATAAALAGRAGSGKVVCIVSGGNIDSSRLAAILGGETPS